MRPTILTCLFVIFGYIGNAQFSILPQLGFENSRTCIKVNELSSFSPIGAKISPQAGIRLDYKFKQLHGPYIGVATSRSVVNFNFSDAATAMNNFTASRGNTQFRLEGGYQVTTKPIYFKKSGSTNKSSKVHCQKITQRTSCGYTMTRSSCTSKKSIATPAKSRDKGTWVRIQPSLGVAYIPSTQSSGINTKSMAAQTSYEYNAGNWKTALISGVGFEFGKNAQSSFMISVNYLRGLGNMGTQSVTSVSGNKPTNTSLSSNTTGWNLRLGIPINLGKKPVAKQKATDKTYKEEKKCGQYKIYYKARCSRTI